MKDFLPTLILRHRKENLKKCSLRGLEKRSDMQFFTYPRDPLPSLENHVLLTIDAPPLTLDDQKFGLFLVDGTWSYAKVMERSLPPMQKRSLPSNIITSYPRKQTGCLDPEKGLASIEALYVAYLITGRDPEGLLENYYWKESFIETLPLLHTSTCH